MTPLRFSKILRDTWRCYLLRTAHVLLYPEQYLCQMHCEDPDGPDYDPDSKVTCMLSKNISLGPEPDDDKLFIFFVEVKVKLGEFQTRAGNRKMTNFIVSRPLTASNAESKHCPQTNRQNRQVFGL